MFHLHTKFGDSRFSRSGDDCGHRNGKWVMWPWPRPFQRWFVVQKLGFDKSICMQNLTILASAVPAISLVTSKFKNGSNDPDHAPILGWFVIFMPGLDIAYMCTKFDDFSLSSSRHMVGGHLSLNGSHDLTTPLSGMVCHPWASTCYDQSIYYIWRLYLYPPRTYDRRYKFRKFGGLG